MVLELRDSRLHGAILCEVMEVDKITEGQTIMRQGEFSARSLLQLAGVDGTDA